MTTLQRYLLRELLLTFLAVLTVLFMVSVGGVLFDLVSEMARGKVPATLLISQLGLRLIGWIPLVLPLALFIALIMGIGRLYRDSEMAVLASVGQGPRQLLIPMAMLCIPAVLLIAAASLWIGPWAQRTAQASVDAANRSFLVAGLEAGRFAELPGGRGVIYVSELSQDGREFKRLFVQSQSRNRVDIITAAYGELFIDDGARFLRMHNGFRVEGQFGRKDFRLQRFAVNEVRLPDPHVSNADPLAARPSLQLLSSDATPRARAEWHWRIGVPLVTAILALLALPLSRSPPREARYGRLMLAVLAYVVTMNLLALGKTWLGAGQIPSWLGMWWLHLIALAIAIIAIVRDGRLPKPRRAT